MLSISNLARTALAKLVAVLYTVVSFLSAGIVTGSELPKTPDNFTPVVRFAVCSDVHLNGKENTPEQERFEKLFDVSYRYAESQSYKNLDAVCVCGDMTDNGYDYQYDLFNSIIDSKIKDGTQMLVCMGNHEFIAYRDNDASQGTRMFEKKVNKDPNRDVVINGYHFVVSSYDEDGNSFDTNKTWLNDTLKSACKDNDKPVFVFNHPAPFATIYGSINWGDVTIPTVLSKYKQVIDFSGHSHYPVNDPRSIWQGNYTAFGCGTLSYYETELDCIAGNFPYDYSKAAQFYIVEADKDGNVRVKSYDLITDTFFGLEYYLTDLKKGNRDYSYNKMKRIDKAPDVSKMSASVSKNEEGETLVTFTGASDKFVVESYKVSATKNGLPFFSDNFSGKYMYLFEKDEYTVNLGVLESGRYNVQVVALNAYAKTSSPFTYSFEV